MSRSGPVPEARTTRTPHLAGVHALTFSDATQRRVLCGARFDTVRALADRRPTRVPRTSRRCVSGRGPPPRHAPHHPPDGGRLPVDLNVDVAADSLAVATRVAESQAQVGRFIVSVLA